jgi:non-heme chloroperoxidase
MPFVTTSEGTEIFYADSAPLSAELVQNGTLKTYEGFPHGMPTTEAETINADLLAFLQS